MPQNNLGAWAVVINLVTIVASSSVVFAQDTLQAPRWYESISVNAFLSSSYSYNFNKPDVRKNQLHVFDVEDNSLLVDVVELSIKKEVTATGDAGFRLDIAAGSSIPRVTRSSGLNIGDLDALQMFITYSAPVGSGLRLDFGKFVTPVGYEVIEGLDGFNDNGSRSFLFGYAIPFTHTGLRATYGFSQKVSSSLMIVNGWDNSIDNNRSKTICGQFTVRPIEGMTLLTNVSFGPERDANDADNRLIIDFVGTYELSPVVSVGVNADYGREQHATVLGENATWLGTAGYLRLNLLDELAMCFRGEQFEDKQGVRTGAPQKLRELTITPEYRPVDHFVLRGDFRVDNSSKSVFIKRGGLINTQSTVNINCLFFY